MLMGFLKLFNYYYCLLEMHLDYFFAQLQSKIEIVGLRRMKNSLGFQALFL